MARRTEGWLRYLRSQQRGIASLAVTVLMANGLVVASRALGPEDGPDSFVAAPDDDPRTPIDESTAPPGSIIKPNGTIIAPDGTVYVVDEDGDVIVKEPGKRPIRPSVDPGPVVQGVTDDTIEVVYYWKGERTMSSPHSENTPVEGANLDEEKSFNAYIDYINKHADGSANFFGLPINLHGRKLVATVRAPSNGASGDFVYGQIAEQIAKQDRPFAAVASHGSLSSYICPYLAENNIFNMQTYDLGGLGGNLVQRTNGYCTPAGLTWERQVDLTVGYLKRQMHTKYVGDGLPKDRVYGVIYTVYPGLKDVGDAMVQRLKDAGIPVAASARLPDSLAQAQVEAGNILLRMQDAGVNTLIMPDAGSPMTITHAAKTAKYFPDYYVWPCSGTDVTGMVRLFEPTQWEGAEGLTCYDREFNPDAVNNNLSKRSEWWKAYKEVRPNAGDPPAPSPLVYSGLFQLVAGLTYAGRDLTPASFKTALDKIPLYRYDSLDGRTDDPTNMLITMNAGDRAMIGDAGYLKWDTTASEGGVPGAYRYPEAHRYRTKADF